LFTHNVKKGGIAIRIKASGGQEIFRRLAKETGFVIMSFGLGHLQKFGVVYEAFSKLNPRLIMTSRSPLGNPGRKAHYDSSDFISLTSSGVLGSTGDKDRPPNLISGSESYLHPGV